MAELEPLSSRLYVIPCVFRHDNEDEESRHEPLTCEDVKLIFGQIAITPGVVITVLTRPRLHLDGGDRYTTPDTIGAQND